MRSERGALTRDRHFTGAEEKGSIHCFQKREGAPLLLCSAWLFGWRARRGNRPALRLPAAVAAAESERAVAEHHFFIVAERQTLEVSESVSRREKATRCLPARPADRDLNLHGGARFCTRRACVTREPPQIARRGTFRRRLRTSNWARLSVETAAIPRRSGRRAPGTGTRRCCLRAAAASSTGSSAPGRGSADRCAPRPPAGGGTAGRW
jgi:hypothetical protein